MAETGDYRAFHTNATSQCQFLQALYIITSSVGTGYFEQRSSVFFYPNYYAHPCEDHW